MSMIKMNVVADTPMQKRASSQERKQAVELFTQCNKTEVKAEAHPKATNDKK